MAYKKTITLEDFAKQMKDNSILKEQKEKVMGAMERGAEKAIPELEKVSPEDTGEYKDSWRVKKTRNQIQVGNISDHAAHVEFGAEPFKPPLQDLIDWAARKLDTTEHDPRARAFAVATQKKIEQEGITQQNIMEKSIDEILIPLMKKEMQKLK